MHYRNGSLAVCCATLLLLCSAAAVGHHGGGSYWDWDKRVGPVTGIATKFAFSFPHVAIYMDITDVSGAVDNYVMSIRWTPTVLRKHGWTRNSIKPGDELTVTYVQHKRRPTLGALLALQVNGVPLSIDPTQTVDEADASEQ